MKNAFSGTMLFMLVIFFIVLFTGYICLSINHTRAFNVKNSLIRVIERNGAGNIDLKDNDNFKDEVKQELADIGYRTDGKCDAGWTGFDKEGNESTDTKAAFCLRKVEITNNTLNKSMYYYQVQTFYHLDVPIINLIVNLSIKGDTKPLL